MPKGGKTKKAAKPAVKKSTSQCCLWTVENARIFVTMMCVVAIFIVAFTAIYAFDQRNCQKREMLINLKATQPTVAEEPMPVAENDTLYLTTYNDQQGLLLNGAFYLAKEDQDNPDAKNRYSFSAQYATAIGQKDIDTMQKTDITLVSPKTVIWDLVKSKDGKSYFIVFATNTYKGLFSSEKNYSNNLVNKFYVATYNLETKKLSEAINIWQFDGEWRLQGQGGFPVAIDTYNDEAIIFDLVKCMGCGYCPVIYPLVVNIEKNIVKEGKEALAFELTSGNSYRYKDYIEADCKPDEEICCHAEVDTLAWKNGSF